MKRLTVLLLVLMAILAVDTASQIRGYPNAPRERSWRLGVEGGVGVLGGDLTKESKNYHFRPLGNVELSYVLHRNFAVGLYAGGGLLRSTAENMESNAGFLGGGLLLELRVPTLRGSLFPLLQLRGGGILIAPELRTDGLTIDPDEISRLAYTIAAGAEVISWRRLGIRVLFGVTYTTTDYLDYIKRGDDNDAYSFALLSMQYYFTGRR